MMSERRLFVLAAFLVVLILVMISFGTSILIRDCNAQLTKKIHTTAVDTAKAEYQCKEVRVVKHNTESKILELMVCKEQRWYKCTRPSFSDTVSCKEIKPKKK